MNDNEKEIDRTYAEIKQLRIYETIVTIASLIISIVAVIIGMNMANDGLYDLFLICMGIYTIDGFAANRVLRNIRKAKAELLVQLRENIDANAESKAAGDSSDDATKGDNNDG